MNRISVEDQGAIMALLADPRTHGGADVERIDTHGAAVFLADDRVFKLKRAVEFPFMDFSTREKRAAAVRAEITLNRRTAPELYLGVAPLLEEADGSVRLGEICEPDAVPADAVEVVLVMRRFPAGALMDRIAAEGGLDEGLVVELAHEIARFHAKAEERRPSDGETRLARVARQTLDDIRDAPEGFFDPGEVERVVSRTEDALERLGPLAARRAQSGRVRHCHGDLHLRNVVVLDGRPRLFDALEFDEEMATIDVLYDLAFLLMDLVHRDLGRHANVALNRWLEETGDWDGLPLLPLFLAMRAGIRAKVARRAAEVHEDAEDVRRDREEARGYLRLALSFLERSARPRLVAVGGLSGTGKTTLARALAPEADGPVGAVHVRSDVIRKHLAGVAPTERLPKAAYTAGMSARVHERIGELVRTLLDAGLPVVVDAVFAREDERRAIEGAADDAGAAFAGLWLDAEPDRLIERVDARTGDASDAGADVVRQQLEYDPGEITWARVPAGGDPDTTLARARHALRGR